MSTVTTIGDRVKLKDSNLTGVVRFIGPLKHKLGIYHGIELDEKKGKCDGSIGKIYYFKTEPKKGLFIKKSKILKTNTKYNQDTPRVTINDTIYIKKCQCTGIIRYIGSPEFISKKRSKSLANTKKSSTRSIASNSRSDYSETSISLTPTGTTPTRNGSNRFENDTDSMRPSTPNGYRSKFATFALNNIWYGIELSKPNGKNNGIVQNKWYFECKPKYGIFVRKEQIDINIPINYKHGDGPAMDSSDEKKSECVPLTLSYNMHSSSNDPSPSSATPTPKYKGGNSKRTLRLQRHRSKSLELTLSLDVINNDGNESQNVRKNSKRKKKMKKRKTTLTPVGRSNNKNLKNNVPETQRSKSMVNKRDFRKNNDKIVKKHKIKNVSDISVSKSKSKSKSKSGSGKRRLDGSDMSNMSNISRNSNGTPRTPKKNQKLSKKLKGRNRNDSNDSKPEIVYSNDSNDSKIEIVYNNYDEDDINNDNIEPRITTFGDRVRLTDGLEGKILFIGNVKDKKGIFYGIELDAKYASKGKNNGSFRGKYYFTTRNNIKSGLFIKQERIESTFINNNKRKRVGINDRVSVEKFDCNGTIKFIGNTEFKKGIWYGIELDEPKGKNNGTVDDIMYFKCKNEHGTFVKQNAFISLIAPDNNDNISIGYKLCKTDSTMSLYSNASSVDLLNGQKKRHDNIFLDIFLTENDLAGFCLIWLIGMIYVIILRLRGDEHVINTQWYSIISIPVLICIFTWLFSYFITKFTKEINHQRESMKIPSFYIPFCCKVFVGMIFFGRLMIDINNRTKHSKEYGIMCDLSLIVMWFHCILSVITSEIMITTVMVSSIVNLDQLILFHENKWYINIFLFVTRPILWVYNRLIVMFVSFYLYYYLIFGIGPTCLYVCTVPNIQLLKEIGLLTLLLPFHNVLYLFEFDKWTNFTLSKYDSTTQTIFAVIQQVLIFTTIFDLLMDFWSVYLIIQTKTHLFVEKIDLKNEIAKELPQIIQLAPETKTHLAVIQESNDGQIKSKTQQLKSRKY